MSIEPKSPRRRGKTPSKGDLRERAILDATERLLGELGFDAMTIADIAEGVGISRAALYFYFGSKQEIVTALTARTADELRMKSRNAVEDQSEPRIAIEQVLRRTESLWLEHGVVMRTAIDLSSSVPLIDEIWVETAETFIESIAKMLERTGCPSGDGPTQSRALARALCWMIERSFYRAFGDSPESLDVARRTCEEIWLRTAALNHS